MSEQQDRIVALVDYYSAYHHHKETMAYAASTLYLSAAVALVVGRKQVLCLMAGTPWYESPLWWLLLLTAVVALHVVGWQYRRRHVAALCLAACVSVLSNFDSEWGAMEPTEFNPKPETGKWHCPRWLQVAWSGDNVCLPACVVSKFKKRRKDGTGGGVSSILTVVLMVAWTGMAFWLLYEGGA